MYCVCVCVVFAFDFHAFLSLSLSPSSCESARKKNPSASSMRFVFHFAFHLAHTRIGAMVGRCRRADKLRKCARALCAQLVRPRNAETPTQTHTHTRRIKYASHASALQIKLYDSSAHDDGKHETRGFFPPHCCGRLALFRCHPLGYGFCVCVFGFWRKDLRQKLCAVNTRIHRYIHTYILYCTQSARTKPEWYHRTVSDIFRARSSPPGDAHERTVNGGDIH